MIYLLHFDKHLGTSGKNSASHYLGWCEDDGLVKRLREHRDPNSDVAIIRAFHRIGATFSLVAVWPGRTRQDERRMKTGGHLARHCHLCNPPTERSEQPWRYERSPGKTSETRS